MKTLVLQAGRRNPILPGLPDDEPGTRLANVQYAPRAAIIGRVPGASEVFNCNATDTGNMELLHWVATPGQRENRLMPLLDGRMRACLAMTEPGVDSSEPTHIATTIRRENGQSVSNGRKWFTTGALHPNCKFSIVMGVIGERSDAPSHKRHSRVSVPLDTPGFSVARNMPIRYHHGPEGRCEVTHTAVRVPANNQLGQANEGCALAQSQLGPGRVRYCMRTIARRERADAHPPEHGLHRPRIQPCLRTDP